MAQTTRISCPPEETEGILAKISAVPGVLSLAVLPGASRRDVIVAEGTGAAHLAITGLLEETVRRRPEVTVSISDLVTLISTRAGMEVHRESSEVGWEEMDSMVARESNMTRNTLFLMGFAGFIAASGLSSGAVHLVIAAAIIAPAFEPISRFSLGVVSRSPVWRYALYDMAVGYLALIAGSALATAAMAYLTTGPLSGPGWYDPTSALVGYWSTLQASFFASSIMAGLAGAILIASHRSVLTAGVLVALSLVPALALVPLALAAGEFGVAWRAVLRWLGDVGVVAFTALIVFGWKRWRVHKRSMIG